MLSFQEPTKIAHAASYHHKWENHIFVLFTFMLHFFFGGGGNNLDFVLNKSNDLPKTV